MRTEYKRAYTPEIRKAVLAFANTEGGVIFIGRGDDGNPCPLEDMDGVLTQVTNGIRDSILPDVTIFCLCEAEDGCVKITVREGSNKPYYLAEKGLKPAGVYVRQGASSVPASFERIREMIRLTDDGAFENARSLEQALSFDAAAEEFARCGVAFGEGPLRSLGLVGADGLYTNLGLLLSDQCAHTVKFAVFQGAQKGAFKTRKEVGGSLLRQMRGAFDFLSLSNNLAASFSGLDRREQYDYPEEALREAMLNSLVHRDYAFSGSTIINIYDDRMEFVTLGGLAPGLRKEDLFLGISQPRNEKLANVFYRLRHIGAYGAGLRRILQCYGDLPAKPEIEVSHNAFMLTLPNRNFLRPLGPRGASGVKAQHQAVLEYLRGHGSLSSEAVQNLLSVRQTRAYNIIREMAQAGLIAKSATTNEYTIL